MLPSFSINFPFNHQNKSPERSYSQSPFGMLKPQIFPDVPQNFPSSSENRRAKSLASLNEPEPPSEASSDVVDQQFEDILPAMLRLALGIDCAGNDLGLLKVILFNGFPMGNPPEMGNL